MKAINARKLIARILGFLRPIGQSCLHLFIIALCIIGLFASLEALAQTYYTRFPAATFGNRIDLDGYGYHPYVETTQRPNTVMNKDHFMWLYWEASCNRGCCDGGVAMRTNSLGFRAPEFSSFGPKDENEVRILLSGGSVPMGAGKGVKCTLEALLKKRLSEHYPKKKITFINLANNAWKSFQELIAFQRYGLDLEPDLVIAFSGSADFIHSQHMPPYAAYGASKTRDAFTLYREKYLDSFSFFLKSLKLPDLLKKISVSAFETYNPYRFLKSRFAGSSEKSSKENGKDTQTAKPETRKDLLYPEEAKDPKPGRVFTRSGEFPLDLAAIAKRTDFSPYSEYVANLFTRNMEMMAGALKPLSGKILIVISPMLFTKTKPAKAEIKNYWKYYAREANFATHTYLKAMDRFSIIKQRTPNMFVLDGNNVTKDVGKHIFGDSAHLTDFGLSLISDAIVDEIIEKRMIFRLDQK